MGTSGKKSDSDLPVSSSEDESGIQKEQPRCLALAKGGIRTSGEFANMMGAMMADLVEGRVTPQVGNAVTNAGGKLLKVVEMQMKYGTTTKGNKKSLTLVDTPAE